LSERTFGKKDDSECATLRIGNLPRAEKVEEVDSEENAGACVAAAEKQNNRNVVPSGKAHPTFVSSATKI